MLRCSQLNNPPLPKIVENQANMASEKFMLGEEFKNLFMEEVPCTMETEQIQTKKVTEIQQLASMNTKSFMKAVQTRQNRPYYRKTEPIAQYVENNRIQIPSTNKVDEEQVNSTLEVPLSQQVCKRGFYPNREAILKQCNLHDLN
ncbi:hypothetical protein FGO68_gene84 [Halteria grandinella]|uniref:Uncharacterized protein n=1 Tax=Halteria grandinella TaxID=5974 RepID=A0A8J8NZ22_HALGN|nr:hypothetical protein FGO68_gene84 [Halteria grandinella]